MHGGLIVAANKRSKLQVEEDRARIAELYKSGKSLLEIGREFGLSVPQISYDLKAIRKAWRESGIYDLHGIQSEQLDKIDRIEKEAWSGWFRSAGQIETKTEKSIGGINARDEEMVRTENRAGDPRFLELVSWCIEQRCKIFGLYAPTRITVSELDKMIDQDWKTIVGQDASESAYRN